ncbi:MAG: F0F1 ATP synthase subunit alpha, partial [Bacteroidales bacterium]|nr:F0F1 ATP synthase subunit alpha [Bacteroidales bacterium]
QYRELEAFAKFGSDLDAATIAVLDKGAKNVEILKQAQYSPMPVEKQIAIIYCGTKGLLKDVLLENTKQFERDYLDILEMQHSNVLETLKLGKLTEQVIQKLEEVAQEVSTKYKVS